MKSFNSQQKKQNIDSLNDVKENFDKKDNEVISRFQVKESKKEKNRKGQGTIYLALKLRETLGWKRGDLLTIKLNKTKDGIEVRKLTVS